MTTFNQDSLNASLEHYGVRGMKWGVKKTTSGAKAVGRGTAKTAKKAKKLTADEIEKINRRKKVGYDVSKTVIIAGAALTASTLLANPAAGAAVSATLQGTFKAVESAKEKGEEQAKDLMKNKF